MRVWLRYAVAGFAGLLLGGGAAALSVRAAAFSGDEQIGPWVSGGDFGSARGSARTRAIVALTGLLALPAREARYYTAARDDRDRWLDGRCRYRVSGGPMPGTWWSLTAYADNYLIPNPAHLYSISSAQAGRGRWSAIVGPVPAPGLWIPTGGAKRFDLTLRVYLPSGTPAMPRIEQIGCGA